MSSHLTFSFEEKKKISTIPGLLRTVESMRDKFRARLFFRGHGNYYDPLLPTIARPRQYGQSRIRRFTFEQEKRLLHRFRRFAYTHLGRVITEWEALLLARHHGLPSRLLDWSTSPLTALYFACADEPKMDGCLWGLARFREFKNTPNYDLDILDAMTKGESPLVSYERATPRVGGSLTNDYVRLVYPISNTSRIITQGGVFTLHSNPATPLDAYAGVKFSEGKLDVRHLVRWRIPANQKHCFLISLETCGISRRSLFPDLDGLCASLWQTEVLFQGKRKPEDRMQ
jgi:FRG domain